MFINIENDLLVLYNLKIYKNLKDINYKISFENGYQKIVKNGITNSNIRDNQIIDKDKMIRFSHYEPTGKYIEYNDFYCSRDQIYNLSYYLYTLPKLYLILNEIIENHDYSKLELLNDYFNEKKVSKKELKIFQKYKYKIYKYIVLEEIVSINCNIQEIENIINILQNHSNHELKSKLKNIKSNLNVYNMNLDSLNHKVKTKKM